MEVFQRKILAAKPDVTVLENKSRITNKEQSQTVMSSNERKSY